MDDLGELLDSRRVLFLDGDSKEDALRRLVEMAALDPHVRDADELLTAVREREEVMSTAIGLGIAVPHARLRSVDDIVVTVGISRKGVDFQAFDQRPVHVMVLVAAPENGHAAYMRVLARLSRVLKDDAVRDSLIQARDAEQVARILGN